MAPGPDALRVSVVAGHDRVDLVVPAAVSVAELVPELLLRLGDDPLGPAADLRLARVGGPPLAGGAGLGAQGIPDGALLTLTAQVDHVPPVPDDLPRVVADAAERLPRPGPGSGPRAVLAVAVVLVATAAAGVAAEPTYATAGVSALVALVLLTYAAFAGHRGPTAAAAAASWLAVGHAGAAGSPWGPAGAAAGCVVVGSAAALVARGRVAGGWAGPVAGGVVLAVVLVAEPWPGSVAATAACTLALVVACGDLVPWPAAGLAGLGAPPLGEQSPDLPDAEAVAHAVRRAHSVLQCCAVATGLLLVVLGPVVVRGLGAWGLVVVLLCAAILALRSRRQRAGGSGLPILVAAAAALLPVSLAAWVRWPGHHLVVVTVTAVVGLVGLAGALLPAPRSVRAGRVAELAEALALVALPPAVLAATGLLDIVRRVVG